MMQQEAQLFISSRPCDRCGEVTDDGYFLRHHQTFLGARREMRHCRLCSQLSLCSHNASGYHGEVADGDTFTGPHTQWMFEKLGMPMDMQHGYCCLCEAPLRWDSDQFRWVDFDPTRAQIKAGIMIEVERRTDNAMLANLMRQRDLGQITEDEYFEGVKEWWRTEVQPLPEGERSNG